MHATPIAIRNTALVTSVGVTAPSACAAIRAKLTNPSETRFVASDGEWIMGHAVALGRPWQGLAKLARMGAMAIEECLADIPRSEWREIPLLLCVAEHDRPGRSVGLDDQLFTDIQQLLDARFAPESAIVAHGRVSVALAMAAARQLLQERKCERVLITSVDSLLAWPTLKVYETEDRLLTGLNSNGFMPGEAGGAVLLGLPGPDPELRCMGIGFSSEASHLASGEPLRADGLSSAIRHALGDAGSEMHRMDLRISDLSGEQYYFKEAELALSRTLRQRKPSFDLWHPAECTGETGAAIGITILAVADAACRQNYVPGRNILAHLSNDGGQRAATVLQFVSQA